MNGYHRVYAIIISILLAVTTYAVGVSSAYSDKYVLRTEFDTYSAARMKAAEDHQEGTKVLTGTFNTRMDRLDDKIDGLQKQMFQYFSPRE